MNTQNWLSHPRLPSVFFGLIAVIYLVNMSPYVSWHDSLGFLYDAATGFHLESNATNHLLFNNLQHILVSVLPFLNPVRVLTVCTVLYSLGSLFMFYKIASLISGDKVAGLLSVPVMALSFTWWQQTEIIEVYAFNSLIFLSYFYFGLKDLRAGNRHHWIWVAALFALSLLTHIQHILSIPFILYYLFSGSLGNEKRALAIFLPLISFSLLILSTFIIKLNTIPAIFFDSQFQSNVVDIDLGAMVMGAVKSVGYLIYNFHIFLFFVVEGLLIAWKKERKTLIYAGLLFIPYFGFGIKYNVDDNYVFFLSSYLVLIPFAALSFVKRLEFLKKYSFVALACLFLLSPLAYGITLQVARMVPQLQKFEETKAYKGGLAHFFWPGKMFANDPLAKVQEMCEQGEPAPENSEWDYFHALGYLKHKGLVDKNCGTQP